MEWVLIAYIYAGVLASGDSVALQSVTGFSTQAACAEAGKSLKPLVEGSAKEFRYVCVKKL